MKANDSFWCNVPCRILEHKSLAEIWTPTLQHYSRYSLDAIKSVVSLLAGVLSRAQDETHKLKVKVSIICMKFCQQFLINESRFKTEFYFTGRVQKVQRKASKSHQLGPRTKGGRLEAACFEGGLQGLKLYLITRVHDGVHQEVRTKK